MIYLVYSGPCVYDARRRGLADVYIGYTGENPVTTAEKYIRQIPGAKLEAVMKDGHIWLDRLG